MNLGWFGVPPLGGSNGLGRLKPGLQAVRGSWSQCAASKSWRPPMNRCSVAQVANLLYRRLLIGEALGRQTASGLATSDTADPAVCATAEAQHDTVPEAGAPVRFMVPMRAKKAWRRFNFVIANQLGPNI